MQLQKHQYLHEDSSLAIQQQKWGGGGLALYLEAWNLGPRKIVDFRSSSRDCDFKLINCIAKG